MKKLIIGLLVILMILVVLLAIVGRDTSKTFYDDAPHVAYENLTDDVEGQNLYYFYQDSCIHCNNIKPALADFYYNKPEDIDMYLLDIEPGNGNDDAWFRGEEADFVEPSGKVTEDSKIQVMGTPTLIEITDGEITQFLAGETEIPEYLETL